MSTATTTPVEDPGSVASYRARTVAPSGGNDGALGFRRGPRRARLAVRRVDPWSVLKFAFVFSLALLIVWVVAVALLYTVLNTMGVFASVERTVGVFTAGTNGQPSSVVSGLFSFRLIVGWAAIIGAVNVLLLTALATLGAFLYNICAELAGGIEVTLTERD